MVIDPLLLLLALAAGFAGLLFWRDRAGRRQTGPALEVLAARADDEGGQAARLIEALEAPAVLLDTTLGVEAHNSAARELFPQLRLGVGLTPAVRIPDLIHAAQEALEHGSVRSVEIVSRSPLERRLVARLTPMQLGEAQTTHLFVQFRDLTEQDRLAQMRSDFIANASHELRTPLSSLRGFIETLRGAARDDEAAREKFLVIMDQQAARMTRILDDLLSLSRIEMRAHLTPETRVDLVPIVTAAMRSLDPLAQERGIALTVAGQQGDWSVRGDRDELEQVFQNLILNAIKYGREQGHVEVAFKRLPSSGARPARFAISVADDGPGIAEEHLPRLTERFYRVDTAQSRERGGTGLGLAIVKHILARHRGDLDIASVTGKGSTFTVILEAAGRPNA